MAGKGSAMSMHEVAASFGGLGFGSGRPVIIAGPCSVESEEQILSSAHAVKAAGATALRGGAFKPRTTPGSFQGLGEAGLKLLAEARRQTGLPVVTEVMDAGDLDLVAQYADVLQIGSRNMQNFSLLKQVGWVGKPVMLKRGLSATLAEWLGAVEYIKVGGCSQVILCERGIRTFETYTRNTLDLSIAVAARAQSGCPVIVDPSHAAGRPDLIPALSEAALSAGLDGLMIEVHPRPQEALSDADQQLDFPAFQSVMLRLRLLPVEAIGTVDGCRSEIDRIDDEILALLGRRMLTAKRVGALKQQMGLPTVQPDRERVVLERLSALASPGLGPCEVRAVWEAIMGCARRVQERVV